MLIRDLASHAAYLLQAEPVAWEKIGAVLAHFEVNRALTVNASGLAKYRPARHLVAGIDVDPFEMANKRRVPTTVIDHDGAAASVVLPRQNDTTPKDATSDRSQVNL